MSAERPEVGDVWEFGGFRYYVRSLDENGVKLEISRKVSIIGILGVTHEFVNDREGEQ